MAWALLPLKDLVQAKSRLSGVLASHERRALAQAMVEDVLAALAGSACLEGTLLVSDDPGAELLAHRYGIDLLPEASLGVSGLNAVLDAACEWLAARGADVIAIVHGDLPLLTAAELDQLLAAQSAGGADVVIAPDRRDDGTNVMIFSPRRRPAFHYGVGSCRAHQRAAADAGLGCRLLRLPGAGLDVDAPADLLDLRRRLGAGGGSHTGAFLSRPDIEKRLAALADDAHIKREAL